MTGRIVATDSRAAVPRYTVPLAALDSAPDGAPFVWVVAGAENRVSKRPVGLGEAVGASVEVVDGLTEGDVVVTAGISKLCEGMRVRLIAAVAK